MSFEDEWSRLKGRTGHAGDAAAPQMRLNGLAPEPGGGSAASAGSGGTGSGGAPRGDLVVRHQDLTAIGKAAYELHQRLQKDGDHARLSSLEAASTLRADFAVGRALDHVATRWVTQLRTLLDACAHISNHLDFTKKTHAGQEHHLQTVFSKIATLDAGFTERTAHRETPAEPD